MGKEFGNMAQGDKKTGTKGTNSIFIMSHKEIKNIPWDCVVTYVRLFVDYRPQKEDPNRVRMTAGGNLISYLGELTTRTANGATAKILWNSVISTTGARYMCIDIKNFYLGTPLDHFGYTRIPIALFPQLTIDEYNLNTHKKDGFIYVKLQKAIYGLS